MPKPLVDLLWHEHPAAPRSRRGPRAKHSLADVVAQAVAMADESGLDAVTVRALAESLGMPTMSVYTHVNTRDDLLVLMADSAHGAMALPDFGRAGWRTRVRLVADANLALFTAHPWLLQVRDPRAALGPGTIAKYDHELHAFDGTNLDDVQRDAALTFLLDFVGSSAASQLTPSEEFESTWQESSASLARYIVDDHPLARRIGQAAGERQLAPYSPAEAWRFGLDRVIAGLAEIIDQK